MGVEKESFNLDTKSPSIFKDLPEKMDPESVYEKTGKLS